MRQGHYRQFYVKTDQKQTFLYIIIHFYKFLEELHLFSAECIKSKLIKLYMSGLIDLVLILKFQKNNWFWQVLHNQNLHCWIFDALNWNDQFRTLNISGLDTPIKSEYLPEHLTVLFWHPSYSQISILTIWFSPTLGKQFETFNNL